MLVISRWTVVVRRGRLVRPCEPAEYASPTPAAPGTDRDVAGTITVLTGDGSLNVSGEEWSGGMQSAQDQSEASEQAGAAVRTG